MSNLALALNFTKQSKSPEICTQIFQEAGQVVWYSHLFQNFPQFIVIHTVKSFGIVNKAEIDTNAYLWNLER